MSRDSFVSFVVCLALLSHLDVAESTTATNVHAQRSALDQTATRLQPLADCYRFNVEALEQRSSSLQRDLGGHYSSLDDAKAHLAASETNYAQTNANLENLEQQRTQLEPLVRLLNEGFAKAADKFKKCKERLGVLCGLAPEATQLIKLAPVLKVLNENYRKVSQNVRTAYGNLQSARADLAAQQVKVNQAEEDITKIEQSIKLVNSSMENVRRIKQEVASLTGELERLQENLTRVSAGSSHSYAVKRRSELAGDAEELIKRANSLTDKTGLLLPTGKRICAL